MLQLSESRTRTATAEFTAVTVGLEAPPTAEAPVARATGKLVQPPVISGGSWQADRPVQRDEEDERQTTRYDPVQAPGEDAETEADAPQVDEEERKPTTPREAAEARPAQRLGAIPAWALVIGAVAMLGLGWILARGESTTESALAGPPEAIPPGAGAVAPATPAAHDARAPAPPDAGAPDQGSADDAGTVSDAVPAPDQAAPAMSLARRQEYMRRARRLSKRGKHQEALRLLKAVMRGRDSATVRSLLSRTNEQAGQYEQALFHMKEVASRRSDVPWYRDKIGRLQLKLGKKEKACAAFRRAVEMLPTYLPARQALRKNCSK